MIASGAGINAGRFLFAGTNAVEFHKSRCRFSSFVY